jgi:hypothetical protein
MVSALCIIPLSLIDLFPFESKDSRMVSFEVKSMEKYSLSRIYPRYILEREVENYKRLVNDGRAVGELDHPDSTIISTERISHKIVDLWWEGDAVIGEVELIPTPMGNIAITLVENKIKLGISSRGLGSIEERGGVTYVSDDFQLMCWDIVQEPSTTMAFLYPEGSSFSKDIKLESVEEKNKKQTKNELQSKIQEILSLHSK